LMAISFSDVAVTSSSAFNSIACTCITKSKVMLR
jgi:hypothetical protein